MTDFGFAPAWSPDGKFIVGTGGDQVLMLSLESHTFESLTMGSFPRWFPDGKHLVFEEAGQHALSMYDLEAKTTSRWHKS